LQTHVLFEVPGAMISVLKVELEVS
jgi:hypothetical protein